jgi:transcriptional regulator with XRE-family HTH domain
MEEIKYKDHLTDQEKIIRSELNKLREDNLWTLEECSRYFTVSKMTLSSFMRGRPVRLDSLKKIKKDLEQLKYSLENGLM